MPRNIKIKIKYSRRLNIPPINFIQPRCLLSNGVPKGEERNPGLSLSVGALSNQADVAAFPWNEGLSRSPQYLDLEVFYKSEFRSDYTGNLMLYPHSYSTALGTPVIKVGPRFPFHHYILEFALW